MSPPDEPVARLPAAPALVVALGTLAGQLLGVIRDVVIAGQFGAGGAIDAFLVAQAVMNLVLGLVAGALAKAVVPVVAGDPAVAGGGRASGGRAGRRRRRPPGPSRGHPLARARGLRADCPVRTQRAQLGSAARLSSHSGRMRPIGVA